MFAEQGRWMVRTATQCTYHALRYPYICILRNNIFRIGSEYFHKGCQHLSCRFESKDLHWRILFIITKEKNKRNMKHCSTFWFTCQSEVSFQYALLMTLKTNVVWGTLFTANDSSLTQQTSEFSIDYDGYVEYFHRESVRQLVDDWLYIEWLPILSYDMID